MGRNMPALDSATEQIVEAHEERIQRLEGHVQTLVGQSTEALIKIEHVGQQVADSTQRIGEKIDHALNVLHPQVSALHNKVEAAHERLSTLEERERARLRVKLALKKLYLPLVIAAASVLATHFGETLWTWLVRK